MGCFRLRATDQTDYPPRPMRPSNWDIFCLCWSILFHIVDLGTDVNVAVHYYRKDEISYVIATIVVVVIPSIVTSCVSARMYCMESENEISYRWNRNKMRLLVLVLQLAPVLRKAEKEKRKDDQEKYYKLMLKEDADVALLRVFESFLESAPQQVLQISFLLKAYLYDKAFEEGYTGYDPLISAVSSFVGMAICLMTYQKNIRYVQEDKGNINWKGSILIFMWHFFVTISRILMISAMVYISWKNTLIFVTIHWLVMTISLSLLESHDFCSSASAIQFQEFRAGEHLANILFSSILGLVYIFTYITPGAGGTCFRYTGFYLACLCENIVGAILWYNYSDNSWLTVAISVMCVVPFVLGCLCMIIYHWKFHPKQYTSPSIMPQRREKEVPETTHLAETPSPKVKNGDIIANGEGTWHKGLGDVDIHTEVEIHNVEKV